MPVNSAGQPPGLATRHLSSSDGTTGSSKPTIPDDPHAVGALTLHFVRQGPAAQDFRPEPPSPIAVADADTPFRSLASPPFHTNPAAPITVDERMAVCSEAEYNDYLNMPDGVSILDALVRGARNSGSSPAPGAGADASAGAGATQDADLQAAMLAPGEIVLHTSQGLDPRIEAMAALLGAIMDFPEENFADETKAGAAASIGAVVITQPAGAAAQASFDGSVVARPRQPSLGNMPTALVKLVLQFLKHADLAMLTVVSRELHKLTPTDPGAGALVSKARASLAPHVQAMRELVALELQSRVLQAKLDQFAEGEGTGKGKAESKMLQFLGKGFQTLKGASERRKIADELNRLQNEIKVQTDGLRLDDVDRAPWRALIQTIFIHGAGNLELAKNFKESSGFLHVLNKKANLGDSHYKRRFSPIPTGLSKEKVLDLLKRLNIDSSAIEKGFDSNSGDTVHAELGKVRREIFVRSLKSFAGVSPPEETKRS